MPNSTVMATVIDNVNRGELSAGAIQRCTGNGAGIRTPQPLRSTR